jgi:hypothetical protein
MAVVDKANPSNIGASVPGYPAGAFALTPSDANTYEHAITVWVGGAGNVTLLPANGEPAVTFAGVLAGSVLPVRARGVMATGTTATALVAVY